MAHLKRKSLLYIKKKYFSEQNTAQFSSKLNDRNWSDLLACNDPEIAYTVFYNTITELFDNCFPLRTVNGNLLKENKNYFKSSWRIMKDII